MFTWLYLLGDIIGAEFYLISCAVCLLIACFLLWSIKTNRGKNCWRTILGVAIPAIVCDILWFCRYCPGGEYINRGIGAVYGWILYPVCLAVGGMVMTYVNKTRS